MLEQLDKHIPVLERYAYSLCKDHNEADDLVQTTLLKAIEKSDKFKEGTDLKAWLLSILYNSFVDSRRKTPRNCTTTLSAVELDDPGYRSVEREATDAETEYMKTLNFQEMHIMCQIALGFTNKEVAESLGMNENTLKANLRKIRLGAKKFIEDYENAKGREGKDQ